MAASCVCDNDSSTACAGPGTSYAFLVVLM